LPQRHAVLVKNERPQYTTISQRFEQVKALL